MAINYLKDLGYKLEDAKKIRNSYPINNLKDETLIKNIKEIFDYFLNLGYSTYDIIKITKCHPTLIGIQTKTLDLKINFLKNLGYSDSNISKMIKLLPQLLELSEDNINSKINYLINFGFNKEDAMKITQNAPQIFNYTMNCLDDKFIFLSNLGFKKDDIIKMVKFSPILLSLSINNIKDKIILLSQLGYENEQIIKMIKNLPILLCLSKDNIKEKIEFYKEKNLDFIVLDDTKKLMQSISLSYARYKYFEENNINIDDTNYKRLFYDEEQFKTTYKIDKETILSLYPYHSKKEKVPQM